MVNGSFAKWLAKLPPGVPGVESVHVAVSGLGACRFASFCLRQLYALPASFTCVVCAASAFERPLTPSQPPYRLSKLWFSS